MKSKFVWMSSCVMLLAIVVGCESVALVGRPTLSAGAGFEEAEVVGQVEGLDLQEKLIFITTESGEARRIRYKSETRAVIRGREHPVTSLRVGDRVALQLLGNDRGEPYTELIRVRGSGLAATNTLIEGTVADVRLDLGYFDVRTGRDAPTRVYIPYDNSSRSAQERARQIRVGDFVRVEGEYTGERRFRLQAFL